MKAKVIGEGTHRVAEVKMQVRDMNREDSGGSEVFWTKNFSSFRPKLASSCAMTGASAPENSLRLAAKSRKGTFDSAMWSENRVTIAPYVHTSL